MTLKTSTQARVADKLLVQLTNQRSSTSEVINPRVFDAAIADAEATFLVEVGIAYDDTDAAHVPVGVFGVLYYLHAYSGTSGRNLDNHRDRWQRGLIALAQTRGGERRLLPESTSVLEPSVERTNARPDFDRRRWDGYVPAAPDPQQQTGFGRDADDS